jgi:predicted nucleic acid-binding protein
VSRVFVDTSALLALLNPDDEMHSQARQAFQALRQREAALLTTSYVLVETYALVSRRFGLEAARTFRRDLAPLLDVEWIDASIHEEALDLLLGRSRRALSLVDATSFVVMRTRKIDEAFAFDRHFEEEGFTIS